jgi:hypothetical protein
MRIRPRFSASGRRGSVGLMLAANNGSRSVRGVSTAAGESFVKLSPRTAAAQVLPWASGNALTREESDPITYIASGDSRSSRPRESVTVTRQMSRRSGSSRTVAIHWSSIRDGMRSPTTACRGSSVSGLNSRDWGRLLRSRPDAVVEAIRRRGRWLVAPPSTGHLRLRRWRRRRRVPPRSIAATWPRDSP